MSKALDLSKFTRQSWAFRFIGAAHLVLITVWYLSDAHFISSTSIFKEYPSPLSNSIYVGALASWLLGSISLIAVYCVHLALPMSLLGLVLVLGQLPVVLLSTTDRVLLALTALVTAQVFLKEKDQDYFRRLLITILFAVWAWPNLRDILDQPTPLWSDYHALKFWGWTSGVPTQLSPFFGSLPTWIQKFGTLILLGGLAWGPLACLLRIRLWPLLWFILTPLALFIGEGLPSLLGTLVWTIGAISLDQRWSNGFDHKLNTLLSLRYLSPYGLLRWPLIFCAGWLCLSDHLSVTPLIIVAMYLLWTPAVQSDFKLSTQKVIGTVLLLTLGGGLAAPSIHLFSKDRNISKVSPWLLTKKDTRWTKLPTSRSSLVLELSEDAGASWTKDPYPPLERVTLSHQPWRPLHPLREERWLQQLTQHNECVEGPFMELIQQRLLSHINRLNTPPMSTPHQSILLRVRRVSWVRSLHHFWREEGKGYYCIPTNLPVLLKARALVKQARNEQPKMPNLAPQPQSSAPVSKPSRPQSVIDHQTPDLLRDSNNQKD